MTSTDIFDLIRTKNRTLNQWEQYYRQTELRSCPRSIQFSTGTRCNLKCRFCDHYGRGNETFRDLSLGEVRAIIEDGGWKHAFLQADTISLFGWGEPLFNREYEAIFNYVIEHFPGLGIVISTNGILFDEKWAQNILPIKNSVVNFSVNAASPDVYQKLTNSRQFTRVIKNIQYLSALRDQSNTHNPSLSMSCVATTENVHELPAFVDLAADLNADSVLVLDVMKYTEEGENLSLTHCPETASYYLQQARLRAKERKVNLSSFVTHQVDYFYEPVPYQANNCSVMTHEDTTGGVQPPSPYFSNTDCFDPWEWLMIGIAGDVLPCCRFTLLSGETSFGNMFSQSFQEIWNGDGYVSLRETINTATPPLACANCARKAGLG